MPDMLEDTLRGPYTAWKADPAPEKAAALLDALHPTIEGAIRTHVGEPNPLLIGRGRRMALQGLRGYDPARGRLVSHLYNHLQGLKRVARKQSQAVSVPERVALDRFRLDDETRQLASELGREPSDRELADRTGFSYARMKKVRTYHPAVVEGAMADPETGAGYSGAASPAGAARSAWHELVYHDLDPYHQKVFEHTLGWNGHPVLPNHVLAAKLGKSPGAVSQAKARIQARLDEEADLSPF